MRTVLVFIKLALTLVFCLPYHLYLKTLAKKDQTKSWKKAYRFVYSVFKNELRIAGCKVDARGRDNIPDEPCLFVSNHRSYFDILLTHNYVGRPVGLVAKKEMEKAKLLNLYMEDIGCLFLDRNDIKQGLATINQAAEYIKMGHSIILFPEGHRNQKDEFLPFKEGGYKMAEKAKCPIVPVAISGSDILLEQNPGMKIKKGKVIVEFGEAFYPSQLPPKERKEKYAQIPDMIQAMRNKHKIKEDK
ncbi:MAG: 1-acyl-sn-glycerol-3-phosphate acyltransferase [Lachnospiraceae bacterium]|nr:1-acyl-sn-glycerol-3-phosphate acyltransferase [Lachnospiraceae bacterium]